VEQFYKIETIVYGTCNKNHEHLFFSGVMRKRAIDSFSFFRPAPAVQKRSECLQWIINMIVLFVPLPW